MSRTFLFLGSALAAAALAPPDEATAAVDLTSLQGSSGSAQNILEAPTTRPAPLPDTLDGTDLRGADQEVRDATTGPGSLSGTEAAASTPGTGTVIENGDVKQVDPAAGGVDSKTAIEAAAQEKPVPAMVPVTEAPSSSAPVAQGFTPTPASLGGEAEEAPLRSSADEALAGALERAATRMGEIEDRLGKQDAAIQKASDMSSVHDAIEEAVAPLREQIKQLGTEIAALSEQRVSVDGADPRTDGLVRRVEKLFTHLGLGQH